MSRGATVRLFAALAPPPEVREQLAAWAREARGAWSGRGRSPGAPRLLRPHAIHLTLCFLGERPADEVPPLSLAVDSLQESALELSVGAPLLLPRRRPRVLAVQVLDSGGELSALQGRVSSALEGASGWQPERRRFTPHITVARMRAGEWAPAVLPPTPGISFAPEAIVLYRSLLEPDGARHEALASCDLAAG